MTIPTTCPDILLLSQVLDQESSPQEERMVTQHLSTCASCRTLMARLHRATERRSVSPVHTPFRSAVAVQTPACLSPATIAAYVHRLLPTSESTTAEQHLHTCDPCFSEVQSAFRTISFLSAPTKSPVPAALKARVAAVWQPAKAAEQQTVLSRIVIQFAAKGLHLVEQHLVAPFFALHEVLVPTPTYRSTAAPARLDFTLTAGQNTLNVTAVPDGNGLALTLTLFGPQQNSLAGQRVFLNQHGKAVLSKKTDPQGVLQVPHLDPGLYEVTCPSLAASFEVELRT